MLDNARSAAGDASVVNVNVFDVPTVNVFEVAFVNVGGRPITSVKLCVDTGKFKESLFCVVAVIVNG